MISCFLFSDGTNKNETLVSQSELFAVEQKAQPETSNPTAEDTNTQG